MTSFKSLKANAKFVQFAFFALLCALVFSLSACNAKESDNDNISVEEPISSIDESEIETDVEGDREQIRILTFSEADASIGDSVTFNMNGEVVDNDYRYTITANNNSKYNLIGLGFDITLIDETGEKKVTKHYDYDEKLNSGESTDFSVTANLMANDYSIDWNYTIAFPLNEDELFPVEILGTYLSGGNDRYVIDNQGITHYYSDSTHTFYRTKVALYNNEICLFADYTNSMGAVYTLREGEVYWHLVNVSDSGIISLYTSKYENGKYSPLTRLSTSTEKIKDPKIGMTAEEVRQSTWGEPKDINKTTTAYGVHEQWVYSSSRYIYFDDGIVTAIQE